MPVKSTYNFVPAPKESEVFKPDWVDQVSHDIPFEDGESGELTLKITAKTPIFIRNGHAKDADDNEFSHRVLPNGEKEYFIPASSLKGVIRNVMEIMSLGRMSQVNNHRHAVRQIMRTQGTVVDERYSLKDVKESIHAGWLIQEDGKHFVVDCGKPQKIRFTDLDNKLGTEFGNQFGNNVLSNLDADFSARTAKYKYENIMPDRLQYSFEEHPLDEEKQSSWVSKFQPLHYVRFATEYSDNPFEGTIVCTGQAMSYNNDHARKGEYVFLGNKAAKLKTGKRYSIAPDVMDTFLFVNRHNETEELADWTFWKNKMNEGIPVFFRKSTGNKLSVLDMGLTFMYKQPAEFSVKESMPIKTYPKEITNTYEPDLAETIFGFTSKQKSLKGRVYFAHAVLQGNANDWRSTETSILLSSPRSSFFPFYLNQSGNNGRTGVYNSFNFKPKLSGFKRYPVHNQKKNVDTANFNQEMISTFVPLKKDAVFVGKVRFHNLRKTEIGALISAFTFHKSENQFFHNIGYAKPFGYGKTKISINFKNLDFTETEYLKAFEFEILSKNPSWHISKMAKEFLAMAANPTEANERKLAYHGVTEFQDIKNTGLYLQKYSVLSSSDFKFQKFISDNELAALASEKERIYALAEAKIEAEFNQIIQEAEDAITKHEFSLAIGLFLKANSLIDDGQLEQRIQNLNKIQYDYHVDQAFENAKKEHTISAYKDFLNKYQGSKHFTECSRLKKELEATQLSDKEIIFPTDSYKALKSTVNKLTSNKLFEFSDKHQQDLVQAIKATYVHECENIKKSAFHKKKKPTAPNKYPWTEISSWIGTDKAMELYNDLIEKPA